MRVTVADTDQSMHVYRDLLQLQPQVGAFGTIPLLDLMGLNPQNPSTENLVSSVVELLSSTSKRVACISIQAG